VTEGCTSIGLPGCSSQFLVHRGYCIVSSQLHFHVSVLLSTCETTLSRHFRERLLLLVPGLSVSVLVRCVGARV
jgi:hypothetical protein